MSIVRMFYHYEDDDEQLPLCDLDIHPELLRMLDELGIIEIQDESIRLGQLQRAYKLLHLKQAMGVNLSGAAVILDLLDRIDALQAEVDRLSGR